MKLLFTILLFLPTIVFTQIKNGNNIEYKLYKVSKDKVSYAESGISDKVDTIIYSLRLGKEDSYFSPIRKITNEQTSKLSLSEIFIETFGEFYTDYNEKKVYNLKEFEGKLFSVVNNFDINDWKLESDSVYVNGYKCKKVTYKKIENYNDGDSNPYIISVWYSDELSNRISPFGLTGLPGGIVKVDFNGFVQSIIGTFKNETNIKTKPNKFGKLVTEKEFDQIQDDYYKNLRNQRNSGVDRS